MNKEGKEALLAGAGAGLLGVIILGWFGGICAFLVGYLGYPYVRNWRRRR